MSKINTREVPALLARLAGLNARIELARQEETEKAKAICRELIETFDLTAFDVGLLRTKQITTPKRVKQTFR